MNIEKFSKNIGYVFTFFAGLLLIIQAFAPTELKNNNLDFILTVLKNGIVELVLIFLVGLLILNYKNIIRKIKDSSPVKYWILGTIVIIFILNISNFKSFAIARYYHYSNISKAYKYQFYDKISKNLNDVDFHSAIRNIERLISIYPEEEYHVGSLKKSLRGRLEYSQNIYPLNETSVIEVSEDGDSIINKNKLMRLLQAFSLYPHNKYEEQLRSTSVVLKKAFFEIEKKYNTNNPEFLDFLLHKYDWLIFDEDLSASLKYRNIAKRTYLNDVLSNNSKDDNIKFFKSQSKYGLIEEKINWKKHFHVCADYKTAANN